MRKRPQIKGKGADIYLGGDPQERPAPRQSPASQQKEPIEPSHRKSKAKEKRPIRSAGSGNHF